MSHMSQKKAQSQAQEQRVASLLGGARVPGSGSLGAPGDVRTERFLVECKLTGQQTLRINIADVQQIAEEAARESRSPAMVFELQAIDEEHDQDWVMVPLRTLLGWMRDRDRESSAAVETTEDCGQHANAPEGDWT